MANQNLSKAKEGKNDYWYIALCRYGRRYCKIFSIIQQLLEIRIIDDRTEKNVYDMQTKKAENDGVSNCPLCALGSDNRHSRIRKLAEMDANHVTAWSKGGSADINKCQMLCMTHNRSKGNK